MSRTPQAPSAGNFFLMNNLSAFNIDARSLFTHSAAMTSPDETTHLDTVQLSASIEIMATKIVADESISTWLPEGTRVYLPDLGPAHTAAMPVAAAILGAAGAVPIPHIAARRVPTVAAFETHLSALSDTGCVT